MQLNSVTKRILTGFMIHVLPGVLLNSSTKMWYSLGRVKVRGKKSHLAASERPASLSRFFRSRLRFFTVRFLRVSWKVREKKLKNQPHGFTVQWAGNGCLVFPWSQFIIPRLFQFKPAYLIIVVKVVYPDVLLHVGVIKILPEPGPITPVKVPLSITVRGRKGARERKREKNSWQIDRRPYN